MNAKTMKLAAIAGGAVALLAAIVCLGGGKATAAARNTGSPKGAVVARNATARPRATYAARTGRGGTGADVAPAAAADAAADPRIARARDLLGRIQAVVGSRFDLPADLQRDILDFVNAGEENRAALFAMVWDPSTSRMVIGHLRVFFMGLKDEDARRTLVAAFDSFDPHAAERAAVAARAKDPSLFVASLRACDSGKEKVDLMRTMPQEAWSEPVIAAWLLEAAQSDADADVRGDAYAILAISGNTECLPVIAAAAGDSARSVKERKQAAFALSQIKVKPSVEELFRLYDGGPDEVRRNILPALAVSPANPRVDDLLLEVLGAADTVDKTRKAAASAIMQRLDVLSAADARNLGARTAEIIKALDSDRAVLVLNNLGGAVCSNEPLRDAVKDLERDAPKGGALQVALVSTPALRFALGRN
jgi:hypothetical protein